jgi:pre-mRNA-splicing factor SYF2
MPPAKKRRTVKAAQSIGETEPEEPEPQPAEAEEIKAVEPAADEQPASAAPTTEPENDANDTPKPTRPADEEAPAAAPKPTAAAAAVDRMARFRALQARAKKSSTQNLAEATRESQRLAQDPTALTAVQRKRDVAAHKLLKAETEEAGDDFERKRAWDWTVEESERWDRRLEKKAAARDNTAFRDYATEADKHYRRQVRRNLGGADENGEGAERRAAYERQKMAAIERAAASGGLDIVETDDGELIAVDKDGSFYSTADSTTGYAPGASKPDKAAVDRLVDDLRKAEETRFRKRRERMAANGDEGDVTYINEKNKQFNQKLSRFYNKYTAEIRDSFERGTMI